MQKCSSIPALRKADGEWVRDGHGKADVLAQTLGGKYELVAQVRNEYTGLDEERLM